MLRRTIRAPLADRGPSGKRGTRDFALFGDFGLVKAWQP
jgi:hypothetical protein